MLQVVAMRHAVLGAALVALTTAGCADRGDMAGAVSTPAMAADAQAMAGHSQTMAHDSSVMVGGQPMLPSKTIVDNAVNSADHTTLVAAVTAAGLVDTLKSEGPFTVFAPVDSAFAALPPGTVDELLKPESREMLTSVLTYHVVPGRLDAQALRQRVDAGGGMAELETVNGQTLTVRANGPTNLVVEDHKGDVATISTYDVYQSNGVIHVIDEVLLPS
jgi:uncharacterized surface protein with fasciclin (FAS1) repeats